MRFKSTGVTDIPRGFMPLKHCGNSADARNAPLENKSETSPSFGFAVSLPPKTTIVLRIPREVVSQKVKRQQTIEGLNGVRRKIARQGKIDSQIEIKSV